MCLSGPWVWESGAAMHGILSAYSEKGLLGQNAGCAGLGGSGVWAHRQCCVTWGRVESKSKSKSNLRRVRELEKLSE